MDDLINNKMFKVMAVLSQKEIIWDMKSECEIPITTNLYKRLNTFINIENWIKEYYSYYQKWLYDDIDDIYDIYNKINQDMIKSIIEFNTTSELKLFYWFDVDRNIKEHFKWEFCPLSKTKLISLGEEFHPNNRLISASYPLVFPVQ